MNDNTSLTVAKICHEMANYLNILKFIEEDCEDQNCKEIFDNVNLLIYTLDFFRYLYTTDDQPQALLKAISNLYSLKNIELIGLENIYDFDATYGACGLLYLIMKSCNCGASVSIELKTENVVSIEAKQCCFSDLITDALHMPQTNPDALNVFAIHTRMLLESCGYDIFTYHLDECQGIQLRKK